MDEQPFFPERAAETPEQTSLNYEMHELGLLDDSVEADLKKQGFQSMQTKGEFSKEKTLTLPEIRLSITELKGADNHPSNGKKVTINYSFRSVPEHPLFFDCYRGELGRKEELVPRVQRYLFEKEVYVATERRVARSKPVEKKWKKKRR